jgi:hypothetical protein
MPGGKAIRPAPAVDGSFGQIAQSSSTQREQLWVILPKAAETPSLLAWSKRSKHTLKKENRLDRKKSLKNGHWSKRSKRSKQF